MVSETVQLTAALVVVCLLSGLSLATAYTLVLIMTLYAPRLCRRSSAFWTLLATMVAYA